MAISFLEQRIGSLEERNSDWFPFGLVSPSHLPPSMELLAEEYGEDGVARMGGKLRRSHSWAGFAGRHVRHLELASAGAAGKRQVQAAKAVSELPSKSSSCRGRKSFQDVRTGKEASPQSLASTAFSPCSTCSSGCTWADVLDETEEVRAASPDSTGTTRTGRSLQLFEAIDGHVDEHGVPAQDVLMQEGITTYMVQNLPRTMTRRRFIDTLDAQGFEGLYDFVHLPKTFGTGKNKGFAFINFVSEEAAQAFAAQFASSTGARTNDSSWRIAPADVQGFHANAAAAGSRKMTRVRNNSCRPLLLSQQPAA